MLPFDIVRVIEKMKTRRPRYAACKGNEKFIYFGK
jgi:hypothetical protein